MIALQIVRKALFQNRIYWRAINLSVLKSWTRRSSRYITIIPGFSDLYRIKQHHFDYNSFIKLIKTTNIALGRNQSIVINHLQVAQKSFIIW